MQLLIPGNQNNKGSLLVEDVEADNNIKRAASRFQFREPTQKAKRKKQTSGVTGQRWSFFQRGFYFTRLWSWRLRPRDYAYAGH